MKEKILCFLLAMAISFMIVTGSIFSFLTAFSFPFDEMYLLAVSVISCLVFSFVFSLKKRIRAALLLLCMGIGFFFLYRNDIEVRNGLQAIAGEISLSLYNIHWLPQPYAAEGGDAAGVTAVSQCAVFLLALLCGWVLQGKKKGIWIILGISPLLFFTLLFYDRVPDSRFFLLLISGLVLMGVYGGLNHLQSVHSVQWTLLMVLPVCLLIYAVSCPLQPEEYVRSGWSVSFLEKGREGLEKYSPVQYDEDRHQVRYVSPFASESLGRDQWNSRNDVSDIGSQGPMTYDDTEVMRISTDTGGTWYLRGTSYAVYENNRWMALDDSDYDGIAIPSWTVSSETNQRISIQLDRRATIYYVPYGMTSLPENAVADNDRRIENPDHLMQYTVDTGSDSGFLYSIAYEQFVYSHYLQVPEEIRDNLNAFLTDHGIESDNMADMIASMVRYEVSLSASYSLDTPAVPDGQDINVWFLEQSDTGYCVHFASAAVLLLRCAGVPARYVTGYLARTDGNGWTSVQAGQAHAWVEYWNGSGWQHMDPTPAQNAIASHSLHSSEETDTPAPEETETPVPEITETPESSAAATPSAVTVDNTETAETGMPSAVKVILMMALILLIWHIVLPLIRRKWLCHGGRKIRTVHAYRYNCFLNRLNGTAVSADIQRIGQKAAFSQHDINDEEMRRIQDDCETVIRQLKKRKNPFIWMLVHLLLCL